MRSIVDRYKRYTDDDLTVGGMNLRLPIEKL